MSGYVIDARLGVIQAFNNVGFWRVAIVELLEELPLMQARIECAFAENHFEEVRCLAHKLYGMALICGTPMLQHTLSALEHACVETPNKIGERLKEFRDAVSILNTFVDEQGIPEAVN